MSLRLTGAACLRPASCYLETDTKPLRAVFMHAPLTMAKTSKRKKNEIKNLFKVKIKELSHMFGEGEKAGFEVRET